MRLLRHLDLHAVGRQLLRRHQPRSGPVGDHLCGRWVPAGTAAAAVAAAATAAALVGGVSTSAQPAPASSSAVDIVLSKWLRHRGATLRQICFAPSGATGDGAFAAADIPAGTALLDLPADLVLSATRACATADVGRELTKLRERLSPSAGANTATLDAILLSVMLVELRCRVKEQRGEQQSNAASWQDWVATLPSPDAVDIPLCWSDDQLSFIRGTPVYGVASARRAWLDSLSQSLPPLLSEVGLSAAAAALVESKHWLRWADALVWSRAVCLPSHAQGEQDEELAMLPGKSLSAWLFACLQVLWLVRVLSCVVRVMQSFNA